MGTEQKNLDIAMKVTGETKYAIDVRVPGMKWAAVRSCPVYGGDVQSFDAAAIRGRPGVRSVHRFPIPDPKLTRGRVGRERVAAALRAYGRLPIERHGVDAESMLAIAERYRLTAYDAAYLCVAEQLGAPLATLDGKLAEAARAYLTNERQVHE